MNKGDIIRYGPATTDLMMIDSDCTTSDGKAMLGGVHIDGGYGYQSGPFSVATDSDVQLWNAHESVRNSCGVNY